MLTLTRTYSIECAHKLPYWPEIHGHSYEVEITLKGQGDYVMPLDQFDAAVKPAVEKLDHRFLNDVIETPSMENIARWFWNELQHLPLVKVAIYRPTLKFRCEYKGD